MLLLTLRAARRRHSSPTTFQLRAMIVAAKRELTMTLFKRERWTESDVLTLPPGEHDYFERKGRGAGRRLASGPPRLVGERGRVPRVARLKAGASVRRAGPVGDGEGLRRAGPAG